MNITHALIAVKMEGNSPSILHFCGYESQPNQACIDSLREELATDPEFGLVGIADFCYHGSSRSRHGVLQGNNH